MVSAFPSLVKGHGFDIHHVNLVELLCTTHLWWPQKHLVALILGTWGRNEGVISKKCHTYWLLHFQETVTYIDSWLTSSTLKNQSHLYTSTLSRSSHIYIPLHSPDSVFVLPSSHLQWLIEELAVVTVVDRSGHRTHGPALMSDLYWPIGHSAISSTQLVRLSIN